MKLNKSNFHKDLQNREGITIYLFLTYWQTFSKMWETLSLCNFHTMDVNNIHYCYLCKSEAYLA